MRKLFKSCLRPGYTLEPKLLYLPPKRLAMTPSAIAILYSLNQKGAQRKFFFGVMLTFDNI